MLELHEDILLEISKYLSTHQMRCFRQSNKQMYDSYIGKVIDKRLQEKQNYIIMKKLRPIGNNYKYEHLTNNKLLRDIAYNSKNWCFGEGVYVKNYDDRVALATRYNEYIYSSKQYCECDKRITGRGWKNHIKGDKHNQYLRSLFNYKVMDVNSIMEPRSIHKISCKHIKVMEPSLLYKTNCEPIKMKEIIYFK
jgi:hypothetical protein